MTSRTDILAHFALSWLSALYGATDGSWELFVYTVFVVVITVLLTRCFMAGKDISQLENLEHKYSRCSLQTHQSTVRAAREHGLEERERHTVQQIVSTPSKTLPQHTSKRLLAVARPIAASIGHTAPLREGL